MRAIVTIMLTGLVVLSGSSARAETDCEPARCAVQAAINAACDCSTASNHGRYVSCVAHVVKQLSTNGTIPTNCKGKVKRCAARSTCGKAGFVICTIPVPGACDLATSTCAGNATVACLTDAQCTTSRCKTRSSAEGCVAIGGTVGTGATCCANCAP